GFYYIGGLRPARYELSVRRIGFEPQTRTIQLPIGQTLEVNFRTGQTSVQLEAVQTVASRIETRTSEVATNVSLEQIESLPTSSRNFLDLAQLAPGVTVTEDRINSMQAKTFQAGGQPATAVNLFIDGTSFKNDLTRGGVAGQDASRGNPFPRNAIQEYRVIAQNFKAEYQKAGSAIITATTRSGSNDWSGSALVTYQHQGMVALDSFQRADRNLNPTTFRQPDYKRTLAALSLGGPIIPDKAHFFVSYEGNYQDRNNRVTIPAIPTGFPALDTVNLTQYAGQFGSPFRETLLFGKLSYAVNNNSSAEFNASNRNETDVRDFGAGRSFQSAVDFQQNVTVLQGRYNYFTGPWLNEAKIDFSRFQRNPRPATEGLVARIFQLPGGDARIGSDFSTQDFVQRRLGLRNDVTFSGFDVAGQHVLKGGASVDFVNYDVLKFNNITPRFLFRDTRDGLTYNYETPHELVYGTGDASLDAGNTEIGLYLQDDWTPIPRLTLNLGVRWDYETDMMNRDYVTPQMVVDTLTRYNSQLPTPLDLDRYIANGEKRKAFLGAFQPRLGFAFAFDDNNRTTLFGGWGIYYDRVLFDIAVDEKLKLTHPTFTIRFAPRSVPPPAGQIAWDDSYLTTDRAILDQLVGVSGRPEAWFIANDAKVPKSTHYNIGVRQVVRDWVGSIAYVGVRGEDLFTLNWANQGLNPTTGRCCVSFDLAPHGFSNFIFSSNEAKTWYDALQLQVERPYQRVSARAIGWGAGLSWTHSNRYLQGIDNINDLFAFPNAQSIPKHPSNDEKNRVVANWIVDLPYLAGFQFSGLATFGGKYRLDVGCPARFCGEGTTGNQYERGGFTVPGTFPYRNIDVRLRKDIPIRQAGPEARFSVLFDVFNVLNRDNFGCYRVGNRDETIGAPPRNVFGQPNCVVADPRRYQLGAEYSF
ncbi:MAG: TonB-dependent receptor, partial [Gemmatimonadaceae bacterium]